MPASGRMAATRMRATLLRGGEVERKLLGAQSLTRAENNRLLGRNERCEQGRWESGLGFESVKRREGVGRTSSGSWRSVGEGQRWLERSDPDSDSLQTAGRAADALRIRLWASVRSEASPGALLYTGKKINPTQVGPLHLASNSGSFYISLLPDVSQHGNLTTVLFICNWQNNFQQHVKSCGFVFWSFKKEFLLVATWNRLKLYILRSLTDQFINNWSGLILTRFQ